MWRCGLVIVVFVLGLSPLSARQKNSLKSPAQGVKPVKKGVVNQREHVYVPRSLFIVIDPGHGGKEEGAHASSPERYCEKELTLLTAFYLKQDLQHLGHRVAMTRETNTTVSLKDRAAFANKLAADLFVSVHYNSAPSPEASGVEVFYFRNANAKRTEQSQTLARYVLHGVTDKAVASSRGVKNGNFAVIRETTMPAILVEGGFLTNPEERKQLLNPLYLRKIARGIALGIEHFFAEKRTGTLPQL